MKNFIMLCMLLLSAVLSFGQITSTSSGGYWKDTSTWIGGIIPVDTNDVVIDGNVILDGYGHACNNLTINSGDTLYNISTSSNNLKIYGNILNNGTVLVKASYTLYPYGDIVNNGAWDTYSTKLEYGTSDELIEINGPFTFTLFRINANVNGAGSYQWYKDGQAISGATGSRYYLHADEDYAGKYYCQTDAGDSRKVTIVNKTTGIGNHQAIIDRLLSQNYPNPFTAQTHIPFKLDKKSNVHLVIYNSLGQKIAEPVSGTLNAGNHKVTFDGSSLQPGIYFYRLEVDGMSTTKRMVILK